MDRRLDINSKRILLAGSIVFTILAVTLVLTVRTHSQQLRALNEQAQNAAFEQIENSADHQLRIAGTDDSPFRIAEVRVKEVSGAQFTQLTGRTTDLVTVCSVPELHLVNTSEKTITGFALAIRDPYSRTTRTLVQLKVSVAPGENYIVKREHFVNPEKMMIASETGEIRQTLVHPKKNSEQHWLPFAQRSDMFITVGKVNFNDGSSWTIKEGGEVR